jgi:hypothetical protein
MEIRLVGTALFRADWQTEWLTEWLTDW